MNGCLRTLKVISCIDSLNLRLITVYIFSYKVNTLIKCFFDNVLPVKLLPKFQPCYANLILSFSPSITVMRFDFELLKYASNCFSKSRETEGIFL